LKHPLRKGVSKSSASVGNPSGEGRSRKQPLRRGKALPFLKRTIPTSSFIFRKGENKWITLW